MTTSAYEENTGQMLSENCLKTAVGMLVSIVETACEHESDLELMRLVNFMDLYRTYLARVVLAGDDFQSGMGSEELTSSAHSGVPGMTSTVSFEQFISDSRLLAIAAEAATRECGVIVATPPPLKLSANGVHV